MRFICCSVAHTYLYSDCKFAVESKEMRAFAKFYPDFTDRSLSVNVEIILEGTCDRVKTKVLAG
jgi:hypothetical protein